MSSINKVVKILIVSDVFLQSGWGLIGPIFAVFLTSNIQGGSLAIVGFVAASYWVVKSLIQPFIAQYLDKNHGERDDFIFLVTGMYVANLIPLGYIFASHPWHIFVLEFIRGVAMACVVPTWSGIFTRHINKGREAFSWSLQSTGIGLAAGLSGAFGGLIATVFGFKLVFILVSFLGLSSATLLLLIGRRIYPKDHASLKIPPIEKPI